MAASWWHYSRDPLWGVKQEVRRAVEELLLGSLCVEEKSTSRGNEFRRAGTPNSALFFAQRVAREYGTSPVRRGAAERSEGVCCAAIVEEETGSAEITRTSLATTRLAGDWAVILPQMLQVGNCRGELSGRDQAGT